MEENSLVAVSQPFKKDIFDLQFPIKIWMLINVPNRVIKWGQNGKTLLIDGSILENYLSSLHSIFRVKSLQVFIRHLNLYGFQQLTVRQRSEEARNLGLMEYHHTNFQKGRMDLVEKITRQTEVRLPDKPKEEANGKSFLEFELPPGENDLENGVEELSSTETGEPCYETVSINDDSPRQGKNEKEDKQEEQWDKPDNEDEGISPVKRARLNLHVTLKTQTETKLLGKKLNEQDGNTPGAEGSVIQLPAEIYENPVGSVSGFEENPEYAGFYGRDICFEKLLRFFDEYLPIYDHKIGDEHGGDDTEHEYIRECRSKILETFQSSDQNITEVSYQKNHTSTGYESYGRDIHGIHPSADNSNFPITQDSSICYEDPNPNNESFASIVIPETECSNTTFEACGDHPMPENDFISTSELLLDDKPQLQEAETETNFDIVANFFIKAESNVESIRNMRDSILNSTCEVDENLCMDQYLKFENSATNNDCNGSSQSEIVEPNSGEQDDSDNNFKLFFNDFQKTLDILYD